MLSSKFLSLCSLSIVSAKLTPFITNCFLSVCVWKCLLLLRRSRRLFLKICVLSLVYRLLERCKIVCDHYACIISGVCSLTICDSVVCVCYVNCHFAHHSIAIWHLSDVQLLTWCVVMFWQCTYKGHLHVTWSWFALSCVYVRHVTNM